MYIIDIYVKCILLFIESKICIVKGDDDDVHTDCDVIRRSTGASED